MDDQQIIQTLIKFFLEEFSEDAPGVAEWLAQNGFCDHDLDEFMDAVEVLRNTK